ncbi:MAG TPA: AMP-binding protein [Acidisarcina sp.]
MQFWKLNHPESAIAALDARSGREWSYSALRADVGRFHAALPDVGRKSLGFLLATNRYECLVAYLGALNAGSALLLLDESLDAGLLSELLDLYRPDWIFESGGAAGSADLLPPEFAAYRESLAGVAGLMERRAPQNLEIHPDLALLLNTSGSTGSPKLVRLTLRNLEANAEAIASYLRLDSRERPITSLPMPYSYGLSVINSHLAAGATIVLSEDGVLRREFWDAVDTHACTSFAGVPYTYQLLLQAGLLSKRGASLRTLTQAGGRLDERRIEEMVSLAGKRGWKFFVMYGQTEATARISYVPHDELARKVGSVGIAIPGGKLSTDEVSGELIYSGPNVMMGYAESPGDLAKGDELNGVLRTGDLARRDEDGYFYMTGRLKRFLKLFGKRFNLDDVERIVSRETGLTAGCFGRDDLLQIAVEGSENVEVLRELLCKKLDLPRSIVNVIAVSKLPRTVNGKLDYQRLSEAGLHPAAVVTG